MRLHQTGHILRRARAAGLAALTAATMAIGLLAGAAAPAQAATLFGHDISWPQCPAAVGGYGLPMPPTSTQFVIVGLTKGLPFTENPCLASQVDWATSRGKPAHAYAMAAFPTSAQLSTHGTRGPWAPSTRAGQLSNVGYAEATYAVASLDRTGWSPPVVWIDVEPRPAQPWPVQTGAQRLENRYVIEGLMRGLRDNGYSYGLYSYANGWQEITGGWRLPGVPVWATAGRLDYPGEALDRCTQPSFSGGRVYISQWYDDTRDYDRTCGTYAFTTLPIPASTLSNSTADFNGDWNNDILARWTATNTLHLYAGQGNGRIASHIQVGTGWGSFNFVDTVGDFSGDGALDVLARDPATGYLWMYRGTGKGGWYTSRVRVGTGWNNLDAILGPGDFDGDQRVDVLARHASTGELFLYSGYGTNAFKSARRVGTGWNMFNALIAAGDVNGDGRADVLARESSTGYLWLYPGNGSGGWQPRTRIGTGWNNLTAIMGPGDLTGDRVVDVVARTKNGDLLLYARTASGGWRTPVRIGIGWNGINAIF